LNLEGIAMNVNDLGNNRNLLNIMGKNARDMAVNLFSLEVIGYKLSLIVSLIIKKDNNYRK
jgi:hypothetical protein